MNTKIKIILSIFLFVAFIGVAYFSYTILSDRYKPNTNLQLTDEKMAPDFSMLDMQGNKVKLSDFFGKPIVINFWASWCPPCKSEMPHFESAYQEAKEEVTFLMVDLVDGQRETMDKGKKYILDNGFTFPVYFDMEQEASYAYRISSIPMTLFLNRNGEIVTGYQGAIDEDTIFASIDLIKE